MGDGTAGCQHPSCASTLTALSSRLRVQARIRMEEEIMRYQKKKKVEG